MFPRGLQNLFGCQGAGIGLLQPQPAAADVLPGRASRGDGGEQRVVGGCAAKFLAGLAAIGVQRTQLLVELGAGGVQCGDQCSDLLQATIAGTFARGVTDVARLGFAPCTGQGAEAEAAVGRDPALDVRPVLRAPGHAGQQCGERRAGNGGIVRQRGDQRLVQAGAGHRRTLGPVRVEQRLTGVVGQDAVRRQPGIEQAAGFQCGLQSRAFIRGQSWMEIDQPPQRCAGPLGADAGGAGRWLGWRGILAGVQSCAFVCQCVALLALCCASRIQFGLSCRVPGHGRLPRGRQRQSDGIVGLRPRRPCDQREQRFGGIELQLDEARAVAGPGFDQCLAFTLGREVGQPALLQRGVQLGPGRALVLLGQRPRRQVLPGFSVALLQMRDVLPPLRHRRLQCLRATLQGGWVVDQRLGGQRKQRIADHLRVDADRDR